MKKMYIALIIIGVALTIWGVVGLTRQHPEKTQSETTAPAAAVETAEGPTPTDSTQTADVKDGDGLSDYERKGKVFEDFVCNQFPQKEYVLVERVNDYFGHDRFAERSLGPDMVFRKKSTGEEFAVECKYRSRWSKNQDGKEEVQWASEQNIANYKHFADERKMPVIVIIGVGGEPQSPAELFAAPLQALHKYTTARKHYLQKFQLNPSIDLTFNGDTVANI